MKIDFTKVVIEEKYNPYEDEYGSDKSYYTYKLKYQNEATINLNQFNNNSQYNYILRIKDLELLFGKILDLSDYKKMFKTNPKLFNSIHDLPSLALTVRDAVNPTLSKKINAKKKLIEKQIKELSKLDSKYRGRNVWYTLSGGY